MLLLVKGICIHHYIDRAISNSGKPDDNNEDNGIETYAESSYAEEHQATTSKLSAGNSDEVKQQKM